MTELAGRVALVTGGGSGIGRALALALAAEGCAVAVVDIAPERAQDTVDELRRAGGRAAAFACDVSDFAAVLAVKAEAQAALGPPSLIFANAGVTSFEPLEAMTPEEVDWIIQTNLMGVMYCVEAYLPDLLARGDGHVIATASTGALTPGLVARQIPYGASKAALVSLVLNFNADYAARGVRATVLIPGATPSRILEGPTLRPVRFGGPGEPIQIPQARPAKPLAFREAAQVAQMTLRAVRRDRAVVITDETRREAFQRLYVDQVLQAFDDLDAFIAETETQGGEAE